MKSLLVALGYFCLALLGCIFVPLFIYAPISVLPEGVGFLLVVGVIALTVIWIRRNINKERTEKGTVRDWTNLEAVKEEQRIRDEEWLENQQRMKEQLLKDEQE